MKKLLGVALVLSSFVAKADVTWNCVEVGKGVQFMVENHYSTQPSEYQDVLLNDLIDSTTVANAYAVSFLYVKLYKSFGDDYLLSHYNEMNYLSLCEAESK